MQASQSLEVAAPRRPGYLSLMKRAAREIMVASGRLTSEGRMLPSYLIVGAQRCGTTSLHRYLVHHRAVVPPVLHIKGVHYFDTAYDRGWSWYRAHFPTAAYQLYAKRRHGLDIITGEGSPYYLFHPAAPRRIVAALPEVKLIVLLRDPVGRAYSHYQHMVFEGLEDLPTFEEALDREPERLAGEVEKLLADDRYRSYAHQHHSYLARGLYADQLSVLFSLFDRKQVLVLSSREFSNDPLRGLKDVWTFLGLPVLPRVPELSKHNAGSYPGMSSQTRRRLMSYYAEPNERLFDMVGRRLF